MTFQRASVGWQGAGRALTEPVSSPPDAGRLQWSRTAVVEDADEPVMDRPLGRRHSNPRISKTATSSLTVRCRNRSPARRAIAGDRRRSARSNSHRHESLPRELVLGIPGRYGEPSRRQELSHCPPYRGGETGIRQARTPQLQRMDPGVHPFSGRPDPMGGSRSSGRGTGSAKHAGTRKCTDRRRWKPDEARPLCWNPTASATASMQR